MLIFNILDLFHNFILQSYLFEREKQVFSFYKLWKSFFIRLNNE